MKKTELTKLILEKLGGESEARKFLLGEKRLVDADVYQRILHMENVVVGDQQVADSIPYRPLCILKTGPRFFGNRRLQLLCAKVVGLEVEPELGAWWLRTRRSITTKSNIELELVTVTPKSLGVTQYHNGGYKKIYEKAWELGLSVCPFDLAFDIAMLQKQRKLEGDYIIGKKSPPSGEIAGVFTRGRKKPFVKIVYLESSLCDPEEKWIFVWRKALYSENV